MSRSGQIRLHFPVFRKSPERKRFGTASSLTQSPLTNERHRRTRELERVALAQPTPALKIGITRLRGLFASPKRRGSCRMALTTDGRMHATKLHQTSGKSSFN